MNKYIDSEAKQHLMKLVQFGAEVQVVSSKMVYVKFNLEQNIEVAYVYNINKRNKYFLERIKPYPIIIKEFDTDREVIDIIKIDYTQFANAVKSHNIHEFVQANKALHQTIKSFEDLFLYYNIPHDVITKIDKNIKEIQDTIKETVSKCNRVFFDKDPENI